MIVTDKPRSPLQRTCPFLNRHQYTAVGQIPLVVLKFFSYVFVPFFTGTN